MLISVGWLPTGLLEILKVGTAFCDVFLGLGLLSLSLGILCFSVKK
jgi:hypothetical protein